jgi:hypothetical protein
MHYKSPREQPTKQDWDCWIHFWHSFTTTGGKLKTPLGKWNIPTHRIWKWYYNKDKDALYYINGMQIKYYKRANG